MRAHQRHGYSHNDVIDLSLIRCNAGPRSTSALRRPIFTALDAARNCIVMANRPSCWSLSGFYDRETYVRFARQYITNAREWRLELAAR